LEIQRPAPIKFATVRINGVKELRGAVAIRYAKERGLDFLIDENSLAKAEARLQRKTVTMDDVEALFEAQLGELYDPVSIFEGTKGFHFLVDRYGDDWIYIPIEGNHPLEEEAAVLRLYRRKLNDKQPQGGGDILELATEHPPRLRDTGSERCGSRSVVPCSSTTCRKRNS
jgi:hypothetical protein